MAVVAGRLAVEGLVAAEVVAVVLAPAAVAILVAVAPVVIFKARL
jgi:hypothetical protein